MTQRSTVARGYDAKHKHERAKWQRRIDRGEPVFCARKCGTQIVPGMRWDLGHNDDRTAWTGPECVTCNRAAGGRNGAEVTNSRKAMIIREW